MGYRGKRPNEEGEVETQFEDYFGAEVRDEILSIENPRKRSRRPRRGRSNPVDPKLWDSLSNFIKMNTPLTEEEEAYLTAPKDDEEIIAAVAALFPSRATQVDMKAEVAFKKSLDHSPAYKAARHGTRASREKSLVAAFAAEDLKDADKEYLTKHAELSFHEMKEISLRRLESKKRGSTVSPSGAMCLIVRNTPKLKSYRPPAKVTALNTCWIWVGPPTSFGGGDLTSKTRIMTYRNGTHIDCDVVVGPNEPFGLKLGQVIQSMVLWLAEKPSRLDRVRGVYIGQVKSGAGRVLWDGRVSATSLNVHTMMELAFSGPAVVELLETPAAQEEAYRAALEKQKRTRKPRVLADWKGHEIEYDDDDDDEDEGEVEEIPDKPAEEEEEESVADLEQIEI